MKLLQFYLLLLSALGQLETFAYYDYADASAPSDMFYQYRTAPGDSCADQQKIRSWINQLVLTNAKLNTFNRRMGNLLDKLMNNGTTKAAENHCCFYEKQTMEKLFTDITELSERNGINVAELQSSGDMGKDLDNILAGMKQVVGKPMSTCCRELKEKLQKLEEDLLRQMEELHQNLNETNVDRNSQAKELEERLEEQEKKLNQLKERIDKLEHQQKANKKAGIACCRELVRKLNELRKQLEAAQAEVENKAAALEMESKDLLHKQKLQENSINALKAELEKRAENVEKLGKTCEKNCGTEQLEKAKNDSRKSIENDERIMKELKEKLNKENDLKNQQLSDNLTSFENSIQQFQDQKESNKIVTKKVCNAEGESKNVAAAKNCCKNIEKLAEDGEKIHKNINQLNDSNTDHLSQLNADLKDLQNRLKEALEKEHSSKGSSPSGSDENFDIKQLEDELNKINEHLSAMHENDNKLNELAKMLQELLNQISDFTQKAEAEAKQNDILNRLEQLDKLSKPLSDDLATALQLEKRLEDLEKQLKEPFDELNKTDAKAAEYATKCRNFDINNMANRIDHLEKNVKKTNPVKPKTTTTMKPRKRRRRKEAAIGGIDYI